MPYSRPLQQVRNWSIITAFSLGGVLGCSSSDQGARAGLDVERAPTGDAGVAPVLRRLPLAVDRDREGPGVHNPIAVSARGEIAYLNPDRNPSREIIVLDSVGMEVAQVGRPGRGPGELSGNVRPFFSDTLLVTADLEQARLSVHTLSGRLVHDRRTTFGTYPLAVAGDSVDWRVRGSDRRVQVGREGLRSTGGRATISDTVSFLQEVARFDTTTGFDSPPTYGSDGSISALGNGLEYEINLYNNDGEATGTIRRTLPPRHRTPREEALVAKRLRTLLTRGFRGPNGKSIRIRGTQERLDTLSREILPHFDRHGLWFDVRGRLWVVGESRDSTFVDVFADTLFLGRTMLPCQGPGRSVSMNGTWLALVCEVSGGLGDTELQLYHADDQADSPRATTRP